MALTQVSTKGIKDGTILNEDISNSAAIAASKVSGLSTDSITEGNSKVEVVDTGSNGYVSTVVDGTETIRTIANSTTINYARIGANWNKATTSGTGISIGDGGNNHDIIASTASNGIDIQSNTSVSIGQNGFPNQDYANFTTNGANFFVGGNVKLQVNSSGLTSYYSILPNADSTLDIGTNTNRFANIYADTLYGDGSNLTGINTDLVSDSSPQLGGTLDCNGQAVQFKSGGGNVKIEYDVAADSFDFVDNAKSRYGTGNDLQIYHGGTHSDVVNSTGELRLRSNDLRLQNQDATKNYLKGVNNGTVELYYSGTKAVETKDLSASGDSGEIGIKFSNNKAIQFHNNQLGIFTATFSMNANTWTTMYTHDSYMAVTINVSSVHNAGFSSATWIVSKSASGGNSLVRTGLNDAYGPARLEMRINGSDLQIRSSYGTYGYLLCLVQYNMDGIRGISG